LVASLLDRRHDLQLAATDLPGRWSRRTSPPSASACANALKRLDARVQEAQDALLEPLSAGERRELRRPLARVVEHHGEPHGGPSLSSR
jgi:hypothetical protein